MRNQQQHAEVAEAINEEVEQLLCRRVDPVRVFDQDAQRPIGGGGKQDVQQQGEGFGLAAARVASADAASSSPRAGPSSVTARSAFSASGIIGRNARAAAKP